jgi:hypothetical protein
MFKYTLSKIINSEDPNIRFIVEKEIPQENQPEPNGNLDHENNHSRRQSSIQEITKIAQKLIVRQVFEFESEL